MKRILLVLVLIFSLAVTGIYADEPNTGHQSESAWVPITLIIACVVVAAIACINGDTDKRNIVTVPEGK